MKEEVVMLTYHITQGLKFSAHGDFQNFSIFSNFSHSIFRSKLILTQSQALC